MKPMVKATLLVAALLALVVAVVMLSDPPGPTTAPGGVAPVPTRTAETPTPTPTPSATPEAEPSLDDIHDQDVIAPARAWLDYQHSYSWHLDCPGKTDADLRHPDGSPRLAGTVLEDFERMKESAAQECANPTKYWNDVVASKREASVQVTHSVAHEANDPVDGPGGGAPVSDEPSWLVSITWRLGQRAHGRTDPTYGASVTSVFRVQQTASGNHVVTEELPQA